LTTGRIPAEIRRGETEIAAAGFLFEPIRIAAGGASATVRFGSSELEPLILFIMEGGKPAGFKLI
jgi:hypothetical protein